MKRINGICKIAQNITQFFQRLLIRKDLTVFEEHLSRYYPDLCAPPARHPVQDSPQGYIAITMDEYLIGVLKLRI